MYNDFITKTLKIVVKERALIYNSKSIQKKIKFIRKKLTITLTILKTATVNKLKNVSLNVKNRSVHVKSFKLSCLKKFGSHIKLEKICYTKKHLFPLCALDF